MIRNPFFFWFIFCNLIATSLFSEAYVGVQGGVLFSGRLTNVKLAGTSIPPDTQSEPITFKKGYFYGGGLGYFFQNILWMGVGFFVDVAKQSQEAKLVQVDMPQFGPVSPRTIEVNSGKGYLRIIRSDFDLFFRYPNKWVEPYFGGGLSILCAKRKLSEIQGPAGTPPMFLHTSVYNAAPGINACGGLRFFPRTKVMAYIEWKYLWAKLTFFPKGDASGIAGYYHPNSLGGGLNYVF